MWTIFTRDIRKIRTNVIALIVVLGVYLICVEYIHDKTSRQLSYIHLSEEEFLKKVKEEKDE